MNAGRRHWNGDDLEGHLAAERAEREREARFDPPRFDLVGHVREQIEAGTYANDARLLAAADAFMFREAQVVCLHEIPTADCAACDTETEETE